MLVEIPVPERCEECERLEAEYEAEDRRMRESNYRFVFLLPIAEMYALEMHRAVCRVWQAAQKGN